MRGLESGCDEEKQQAGASIRIRVPRVGEGRHPLSAHSCTPEHAFAVLSAPDGVYSLLALLRTAFSLP